MTIKIISGAAQQVQYFCIERKHYYPYVHNYEFDLTDSGRNRHCVYSTLDFSLGRPKAPLYLAEGDEIMVAVKNNKKKPLKVLAVVDRAGKIYPWRYLGHAAIQSTVFIALGIYAFTTIPKFRTETAILLPFGVLFVVGIFGMFRVYTILSVTKLLRKRLRYRRLR